MTKNIIKIKKILIANRAEIACRIIRTCRKMHIRTVAVYSDVDRDNPHVLMADEAYHIGHSSPDASYLNMDKIIEIAKISGADAIHPGYGFLSENSHFAKKVQAAGIVFIGPSPEAIDLMGNKLDAKATLAPLGIPMVPGTDKAIVDVNEAIAYAQKIGLPVLIKASAGGGGKGMRKISNIDQMASDIERAMSEAKNAFGDSSVFVEKFVEKPRHIEFQILADHHGNIVHLFERECSIQRRHQKVVEEAPSAILSEELRRSMGATAVQVAEACNYRGAGTVEFLLDASGKYYFLEMNTRLQVEHPVTEMITGLDLVQQQIRVAQNEVLGFGQNDLNIDGHSIELRVYAEDPKTGFTPSVGKLQRYVVPQADYIRVEDGFRQGMDIPIDYDPMISKLVVKGRDRLQAIEHMIKAIKHYQIEGVETTLNFGLFVMYHEAFRSGQFDTLFVEKYFKPDVLLAETEHNQVASLIAVAIYDHIKQLPS